MDFIYDSDDIADGTASAKSQRSTEAEYTQMNQRMETFINEMKKKKKRFLINKIQ